MYDAKCVKLKDNLFQPKIEFRTCKSVFSIYVCNNNNNFNQINSINKKLALEFYQ